MILITMGSSRNNSKLRNILLCMYCLRQNRKPHITSIVD